SSLIRVSAISGAIRASTPPSSWCIWSKATEKSMFSGDGDKKAPRGRPGRQSILSIIPSFKSQSTAWPDPGFQFYGGILNQNYHKLEKITRNLLWFLRFTQFFPRCGRGTWAGGVFRAQPAPSAFKLLVEDLHGAEAAAHGALVFPGPAQVPVAPGLAGIDRELDLGVPVQGPPGLGHGQVPIGGAGPAQGDIRGVGRDAGGHHPVDDVLHLRQFQMFRGGDVAQKGRPQGRGQGPADGP